MLTRLKNDSSEKYLQTVITNFLLTVRYASDFSGYYKFQQEVPLLSDSGIGGVIIYGNRFKKTTAGSSAEAGFISYFIGNWKVLQIMSGDLG